MFNCSDLIILNLFDKFDMNSHKRVLSMDFCKINKNRMNNNSLPKTRNSGAYSINQTNDNNSIKFKQTSLPRPERKNNSNNSVIQLIDNYFNEENMFERTMPLINHKKTFRRLARYKNIKDNVNNQQFLHHQTALNGDNLANTSQNQKELFRSNRSPQRHNNFLPPIHQQTEDADDKNNYLYRQQSNLASTTTSFLFHSTSAFSQYLNPQRDVNESKIKLFQNQIFTIFAYLEDGRPVSRMKQFKQLGIMVLSRQLKMLQYPLPKLWKNSKINQYTLQIGVQSPLKDLLYKMKPNQLNQHQMRIYPRALHKKLKANQCQQLRLLLRSLCNQMKSLKGKIINNKINLGNLFLTKDYQLCLAQWGYASFRQTYDIQTNFFQSRLNGFLRGDKDWFVSPQYLAPEIISQLLGNQDIDIWMYQSSPDIWSLGLVVFQILTLIPIWANSKCCVAGRPDIIRNGLLSVPGRDLQKLHEKQIHLQKNIRKCLEHQSIQGQKQICNLILKMVEPNASLRITWEQLLKEL